MNGETRSSIKVSRIDIEQVHHSARELRYSGAIVISALSGDLKFDYKHKFQQSPNIQAEITNAGNNLKAALNMLSGAQVHVPQTIPRSSPDKAPLVKPLPS